MIRLGILATHPIQYHAPLFRQLASYPDIELTVYFCHRPTSEEQGQGFGIPFQWDVDLISGYPHIWLKNQSAHPSLISFRGLDTPEIINIIEQKQFDAFIVHGWNKKSCWQAFSACWRTQTPLFVRSDSQLAAQKSNLKKLIKKLLYPLFISRFDVCLAMGKRSAEYFHYFGGKRVITAPHFVDNAWFGEKTESVRKNRKQLRSQWGIDEDEFVFLFAGKFEFKKRPLNAIEAIAQVTKSGRNAVLLMAGDGELRDECELFARDNNLPVRFSGFLNQSKIPEAYTAADCLVLCSDARETWGLVVNEAMACGLPAIVSCETGCMPDLIIEGKTGYSYKCGDISTLSDHMLCLINDPDHVRSLSMEASRHIRNYNVQNVAEIIIQVLHDISSYRNPKIFQNP
ncbi:MAG: glycosyltransferase family 4 protein [Desulfobacterales bacterium]|nr:glycosyltransferase family 4 protein [Desulfobacterales bacterium]